MSEGTLQPEVDSPSASVFEIEFSNDIAHSDFRKAVKLSDFPRVSTLKKMFASIKVIKVTAEARQCVLLGDDTLDVQSTGHIFLAIIPSVFDTDNQTGGTPQTVANVPNKQNFPLSSGGQNVQTFSFKLDGYELDLAQDPRRGAAPVAWIGNTGFTVSKVQKGIKVPLATITWRLEVEVSGTTPLWF
jgi:hypothetical protein